MGQQDARLALKYAQERIDTIRKNLADARRRLKRHARDLAKLTTKGTL